MLPIRSNPQPLIVKLSHFKDEERVLKVNREKSKNQQSVTNTGEPDIEGSE